MLKLALVRLNETLPDGVRMLLPVHDSVLLEVPSSLVEETWQILVAAMEAAPTSFAEPLKVEVKAGRTWAECERATLPLLRFGFAPSGALATGCKRKLKKVQTEMKAVGVVTGGASAHMAAGLGAANQ